MQSIDNSGPLHTEGRALALPFRMVLADGSESRELVCHQMLRFLPGKRMVCRGTLDGRPVAAKILFSRRHCARHAARDRNGVELLAAAGVPTPALLLEGRTGGGDVWVLVFEWIGGAVDLARALDGKKTGAGLPLLEQAAFLIGCMHDHGVYQEDIHPGNFLVTDSRLLIIDGDAVRRAGNSLPPGPALANLGLFAAQFNHFGGEEVEHLLAAYGRQRGWSHTADMQPTLLRQISRHYRRRQRRFLKKVVRECSAFTCRRTRRRLMICDRRFDTPRMRRLLEGPDDFIARGTLLKDGNSATVVRLRVDDHDLVLKRYNIKGPAHYLRRCLRPSRAVVSWKNAHRLLFLGVATPQPVAFAETRRGFLRSTALFVMRHTEGPDLFRRLGPGSDGADAPSLCVAFGDLLQKLAVNRITHGDFKATNFIVSDGGLSLLDLDGMVQHRLPLLHERALARDLRRFLKNWDRQPEIQRLFLRHLRQKQVSVLSRILPEETD